jgi:taurine dioxygenase
MLDIRPVAGALGAEISGVCRSEPITDNLYSAVREALVKYQVIFVNELFTTRIFGLSRSESEC